MAVDSSMPLIFKTSIPWSTFRKIESKVVVTLVSYEFPLDYDKFGTIDSK